jgi:hypothetical protein
MNRLYRGELKEDKVTVSWEKLGASRDDNGAHSIPPTADQIAAGLRDLERQGYTPRSVPPDASKDPIVFSVIRSTPHEDFAKFAHDILTMLGTLLTRIMSFYFGARAVEAGANISKRRGSDEEFEYFITALKSNGWRPLWTFSIRRCARIGLRK